MADMLNTAVTGLLSFQRALNTTSHNIANVNTEGYSRQRVELATNTPIAVGGHFVGNGTHIKSIGRFFNQFLVDEVRDSSSAFSRVDTLSRLGSQIDDILADPVGGISPILHDFFASVQDLADDPSSSTARNSMIFSAQTLAARYNNIDGRLNDLSQNLSQQTSAVVQEINDTVIGIRDINVALNETNATGNPTQQSADLLDRRDKLINQLASKIDITVIENPNNQLSIFVGNGQVVLSGFNATTLSTKLDPGNPSHNIIVHNGVIGSVDISAQLSGGELGGLLEFGSRILDPVRNALGRSAVGLAQTFNAQMRDGMDLNGNLGQDFFAVTPPLSIAFTSNAGGSSVSTAITDASALTTDNYQLEFDGVNWNLTSDSGSSSSVANGSPATLVFEGLTLTINGATAVAGDKFTIKPTLRAASGFKVLTSDTSEIAAALPIRSGASLSNLGDVKISAGTITDVTNINLLKPANFTFANPPTTLTADVGVVVGGVTIAAGGTIPFSNNMTIDANGWQVNLQGVPQAGDVFTVRSNTGGVGDNRNALNLTNLQNQGVFDGTTATYQQDYSNLVGLVGSRVAGANLERDAQQSLLTQAIDRRDSVSSVNLDEEAADLVRYQQAYEATARVISTAQTLFESLLSSVR